MDFEEPDLEELIQNDLRSEMNKILSQSEVEELEAAARAQAESPIEQGTTSRNPSNLYRAEIAVKMESEADESQMVHGAFDVINTSSLQELSQHEQLRQTQEISGHFSVGSYSDFASEMGHLPPLVTEHNDLQSLTWLTTVDVQALQKLTEQGTVNASAVQAAQQAASSSQGLQEHCSVIQMAPRVRMQEVSREDGVSAALPPNPQVATTSTPPRYMPIQPNLSPESQRFFAQPRYHLHPGGGPMGRHSFEGTQMGPRRYMPSSVMGHHPYPPPPYTAGRGAYMHGGPVLHHRYHHAQQQKVYPKPVYSYSCLIAMALYNSKTGCLPVSEIYNFMMEKFPYFKTAPDGWKNSVRHNLSLNKCFEKVEKPNGSQRKGCLWALNPAKIAKMKEEVQKWKRKDPDSIRRSMSNPEELDRELEEMRRSDEEAARRRMLTLSSHGLTASSLQGSHPHHPHHPPNLIPMQRSTGSHMNTLPAGPSSVTNTPHRPTGLHFSRELAQQNFALTLARSASQPPPARANPYELDAQGAVSSQGSLTSSLNVGSNNNNNSHPDLGQDMIVLTPSGRKSSFFSSPQSASSTSSNNTGSLATFTDCTAGLGVEEDLEASLADLAGLHDSFWDGPNDSQAGTSGEINDAYHENERPKSILTNDASEDSPCVSSDGHIRLPPVIRMLSSTQSEQPSPDTPDFKTPSNQRVDSFGRDMSHFVNNNVKPVVML